MISGILLGFVFGLLASKIIITILFSILLLGASFFSLTHAPWSAEWNYSQGYLFHEKYDFGKAKKFYRRAISIDSSHSYSRDNLRIIKLEELSDAALREHEEENYLKAQELYNKILSIDPNNSWALENLNKLP